MSYSSKRFRGNDNNMYDGGYNNNAGGGFKQEAGTTFNSGPQGDNGGGGGGMYHKPATARPNNILIMTILNQKYVITIEAIHKISSRFGNVSRIVMIRKKGTQAMVEFDDVDTARRAMDGLQNQDIYSGCCTLRVDFSKTTKLNVRRNDSNTWDFTVQPQLTIDATRQPLISDPAPYQGNSYNSGNSSSGYSGGGPSAGGGGYQDRSGGGGGYNSGHHHQGGPPPRGGGGGGGPGGDFHSSRGHHSSGGHQSMDRFDHQGGGGGGGRGPPRTAVAIIYGLTDRANCQHVFNLFCLHGNVNKVKFMKSKPGCCMIEFGDTEAVTRSQRMSGVELFGEKLTIRPSKSAFIGEPKGESFTLPDKTAGYEDFTGSKFNRFSNPSAAQKNRIQEPRATIHFYNAPVDVEETRIQDIFEDERQESLRVRKVVMFPKKEGQKSSAGLIEFENIGQAISAMGLFNHFSIESGESSYPYNMKLCFATQELNTQ